MHGRLRRIARGDAGQGAIALVVVLIAVVISAALLLVTMQTAISINKKAATIKANGQTINQSTDSVLQLTKTNDLAKSILNTAKPLDGQVTEILRLAKSIDGLAISINGTAGTINSTARGINGVASTILSTARSINAGVATINRGLDTTIGLAKDVKGLTGKIVVEADTIHRELAKLAPDGH
ncbi:MAG: hypothetical protein ACRDIF_06480 [Actinomycetota bacterium]